jgi:hypothetical protein
MPNYAHVLPILFPKGPAKAKIIGAKLGKRRDPEAWDKRVDTLIINLAVIHASGKKMSTKIVFQSPGLPLGV